MISPSTEQVTPKTWRRRGARLMLIGAFAAALLSFLPAFPREQALIFRFDDDGIRRLEATWTALGTSEPAGGVTIRFEAPIQRSFRHALLLPNGQYVFNIAVERKPDLTPLESIPKGSAERLTVAGEAPPRVGSDLRHVPTETTYVRRVSLEGGETVIRL